MRSSLRLAVAAAVVASVTFAVAPVTEAAAKAKAGAACTKRGATQTVGTKKFTCVTKGKKLVWNAGKTVVVAPKPSATPAPPVSVVDFSTTFNTDDGYKTLFNGPCANDPNIPAVWSAVQSYFMSNNRCAGQLQIGRYQLGSKRPTTAISDATAFNDTAMCKLVTPRDSRSNLGFTTVEEGRNRFADQHRYPSPNTVIQLIPIYADDTAKPVNSPAKDYAHYLQFVKDWIDYSSDFGSNAAVRIPDNYIKMAGKLADYQLLHTNNWNTAGHVRFNADVVKAADPVIDFTGANIVFVVPPPNTDAGVFGQAALGSMQTNEGYVAVSSTQYGALAANPQNSKYTNLGHPFWWIHELFHAGYGFDDHYGDTRNDVSTEYGMGWMTMMTPWGGDLTTWEKWILGFMRDSQVRCVTSSSTSTHWIVPSTVNSQLPKLTVVPVSSTKAILVESLRPAGLYYKHPAKSQGVIVYELDLMKDSHGMGMKLSLPIGRQVNLNGPFFMADVPLKQGEATELLGRRVTVVESGTFGDVVRVEKVAA